MPPKYSATATSTPERELVGWPEPAAVVLRMISSRMVLALACRSAREGTGKVAGTIGSPLSVVQGASARDRSPVLVSLWRSAHDRKGARGSFLIEEIRLTAWQDRGGHPAREDSWAAPCRKHGTAQQPSLP